MAGGMGGFFGYYSQWFNKWGPFKGKYPNPEQFRTRRTFWRGRFLLDMQRANDLTDGYCLRSSSSRQFVFYKEGTDSIRLDLSAMKGPQSAIAIETTKGYKEMDLGRFTAKKLTWNAPYESDWAIAVGRFER